MTITTIKLAFYIFAWIWVVVSMIKEDFVRAIFWLLMTEKIGESL